MAVCEWHSMLAVVIIIIIAGVSGGLNHGQHSYSQTRASHWYLKFSPFHALHHVLHLKSYV